MARTRKTPWWTAAAAAATSLLARATAESIAPMNWTAADSAQRDDDRVMMQISINENMVPLAAVLPLTAGGGQDDIPPTGLSDPVILAMTSNALNIGTNDVAFISCDPYPGQLQATDVFDQAWQTNATAIVLYSVYSDWCNLTDYPEAYPWIYTLKNRTDTARLLQETNDSGSHAVYATIGSSTQRNANGTFSAHNGNGNNNGDGTRRLPIAPPSTAVAMVILYAITGVITALFLCIILTGALRAHRHPERYGPRNIVGRPRQSRAKGLARAMLETLPIVKFGDPHDAPKPTDVELADQPSTTNNAENRDTSATEPPINGEITHVDTPVESRRSIEQGIAAAIGANTTNADKSNDVNHLGCSICTEDFVAGEDQRVLPCDHRFHPACVDPWLLNVSGTCPLCRIDLRPSPPKEESPEVDEHGNPIPRDPGQPLDSSDPSQSNPATSAGTPQRLGVRASLVEGFRGLARPPPVAREERLAALQMIQARRESTTGGNSATAGVEVAQEERRRQRLRRLFGVRTRRTGRDGTAVEDDTEDTTQQGPSTGEGAR